jgi:Arc/MetJ-type ribon-helix-helix transcriptional regulator
MGAKEPGSDKARSARQSRAAGAPPELSALERALRQALDAVPRDQVVKCIVSVLPATVFVEESGRLHGSKVRKVSVSMPEELAEAVRARTGSGGFSRYVTDAVEERVRLESLDELLAELDAEYGPVPDEIRQQTRRMWPDHQE